jgi:hypothetical protein
MSTSFFVIVVLNKLPCPSRLVQPNLESYSQDIYS